ncbi:MAG: SRPBCC family protein [Flavobacteriales bacterium]|nr:SRPBCC family protein [Flavobacteriales bacterium]MCX7767558.1 SRPBCC family protein [Flavobacteriales bacterium]MDW8410082.1 SRPBCC family protein [Flavobacteriales bacterium]
MKIFRFETIQHFAERKEKVWKFISTPYNLSRITPPDMDFRIVFGPQPSEPMYAGQIIVYSVRPLWNVPVRWVTEITHVRKGEFFVDEQRIGPYVFWHHQHILEDVPGGVGMRDIVHYVLPGGFLSSMINKWIVEPRLKYIFDYRRRCLQEIFVPLKS